MLEQILNSGELDRGVFDPFFGEYFDPGIRSKFITEDEVFFTEDGNERIEFSVYDSELNLVHWTRDVGFDVIFDAPNPNRIELDIFSDIQDADLPDNSEYSARYNFFRQELPTPTQQASLPDGDAKMYVQEISNNRKEIRVRTAEDAFRSDFNSFFGSGFGQNETKLVVNFENNAYKHLLNWERSIEVDENGNAVTDGSGNPVVKAVVLRLQSPLQDSVEVGDEFVIDREFSFPYFDQFSLFRDITAEPINELAAPDFSAGQNGGSDSETEFETLDDLLENSSEEFAESAFGSGDRVDLNVDYRDFGNFIHFSSAEERLLNFRFKLRILQDIQEEINELSLQGDATGRTETLRRRAEELIGSFDDYEQWLFDTDDAEAYPKTDSNSLVELDSVEAQDWFSRKLEEARDFDDSNDSALRKQIPRFVREDDRNQKFVLFVDLVAQWFDVNWLYVRHFEYFTDRTENIFMPESLSSDLSKIVGESFGFEMYNGLDADDLFDEIFDSDKIERLFGEDFTGQQQRDQKEDLIADSEELSDEPADVVRSRGEVIENVDGITKLDLTRFQAQQQIWRRLLNTIIHKFKTKGTERSISALLSVFGIPRNSFVVREFGGVPQDPNQVTDAETEIEDSTAALQFFSEQYLQVSWDFTTGNPSVSSFDGLFDSFPDAPKSMEMRFRSEFQGGSDMKLLEINDVLEVRAEKVDLDEPEIGRVTMEVRLADATREIVTSQEVPLFDGRWNNLLVRLREDEPFIDLFFQRRSPFGDVTNERQLSVEIGISTAVNFLRASDAFVGGKIVIPVRRQFEDGVGFIGDLDQVMMWRENVNKSRFDDHTLAPAKFDFNNEPLAKENEIFDIPLDEIRNELMLRLDFDEPKDIEADPEVFNEAPSEEFFGPPVPAIGWPPASSPPWQFVPYERVNFLSPVQIGASTFFATKVRIEDTRLEDELNPQESVKVGELQNISQDSRKLGLFFSPTEAVNRDVFFELGVSNINGFLADPRDLDGRYYSGLRTLSDRYWEKYERPVDRQMYIRFIDQFYDALFKQLRKCVPARARLLDGVVLKNDALYRDRHPVTDVDPENRSLDVSVSTNVNLKASFPAPVAAIATTSIEQLDVTTETATSVTSSSATLQGELTVFEGFDERGPKFVSEDARVGFEWRQQGASSFNRLEAGFLGDSAVFSADLSGLQGGSTYEVKATAEANGTLTEGTLESFTAP